MMLLQRGSLVLLLAFGVCAAMVLAAGGPGAAAAPQAVQTYGPIPLGTLTEPAPASPVPPDAPTTPVEEALTPSPTPPLPDWADAQVVGTGAELRVGVGTDFNSLGLMPPGTPLRLVGRNTAMTWFQVISADQRVGWVGAQFVTLHRPDLSGLPVGWVEPEPIEDDPAAATTPGLSPAVIERAEAIYRHGQQLGNNPNTLMLIGDSVNEEGQFLKAFADGNYDLGTFTYLQPTIDAYNTTGAFSATYQTEHTGLTYAMILDPLFANPDECFPGESALDCEYRLKKPSIAIIYLGLNDMRFFQPEDYRYNMQRVMQTLIGYGVIPVLTTFTIGNEYEYAGPTPDYLQVMREVAASLQIPLIDFYEAAETLPHRGTGEDSAHLTFPSDRRISFTGDQRLYGTTLRELLTLQTLHDLRVNAFGL